MYTTRERAGYDRLLYNEKDYLLADRFYPGELGMVILLGIASLLVWSLCIWGITNEPKMDYGNSYTTSDATLQDTTTTSP